MESWNAQNYYRKLFSKNYIRHINCDIHGENVKCYINGRCEQCAIIEQYNKIALKDADAFNKYQQRVGIPKRYLTATFKSYIPKNEKSKELLDFFVNYAGSQNLLLLGKTGTGKTHLACAFLNQYRDNRIYIPFYKISELKINAPHEFDRLLSCNYLVIDEYGVLASDFNNNLLFYIINERYNNEKPTMIISNLTVEKFKDSTSDAVKSRLKEDVITKICDWEDYRINNCNS